MTADDSERPRRRPDSTPPALVTPEGDGYGVLPKGGIMAFQRVCAADALAVGTMAHFEVGGRSLLLYHLDDGFYATQRRCSHTLAALDKGRIVDGDKIRCWLHRAVFDIRDGRVIRWANWPPGIRAANVIRGEKDLTTYPTRLEDGVVYVDI